MFIAAARAARFEVTGYYFDVELEAALKQNGQRTGKHLIPSKGVVSTFRRLEPPVIEEGFDRLYTVQVGVAKEWIVRLVGQSDRNRLS